jgi:pre-rRNA-processing protein TSR4
MVLLLQLNGELPDRFPGHERRLYVFACKRKSCRRKDGSIRTLRGVRIAPGSKAAPAKKLPKDEKPAAEEPPKPQTNLGETLFGAKGLGSSANSANPFATSSSSSSNLFAANPFSSSKAEPIKLTEEATKIEVEGSAKTLPKSFAETLSLNNPQKEQGPPPPPEPWPAASDLPTPYSISYLADADYETLDPTPPTIPQATRMDVDEPGSSSGGKEDREVFESSMDADFQKFADRLAQNPEQVIRYEFGGQPLLYSKTDAVGQLLSGNRSMPRCGNCGSGRTFEVQLTPNAIAELEAEELSLEGMDWGTIIVGVCESDCQARGVAEGEAGYLEEWAGVQWEELSSRR